MVEREIHRPATRVKHTWLTATAAEPLPHLLVASALRIKLVQHGRHPRLAAPCQLLCCTIGPGALLAAHGLRWRWGHGARRPAPI